MIRIGETWILASEVISFSRSHSHGSTTESPQYRLWFALRNGSTASGETGNEAETAKVLAHVLQRIEDANS